MKLEDAVKVMSEHIDALLQQKDTIVVAIDGNAASGKSTLAHVLHRIYVPDANIFRLDDFFLRPEQRTPERLAEPGGNVDRERFEQEVLLPVSRHESVTYRRYNCAQEGLEQPIIIQPNRINIIEGTYSLHPQLEHYYDFSVVAKIATDVQAERIARRNPGRKEEFFTRWIPMEQAYFAQTGLEQRCSLLLNLE